MNYKSEYISEEVRFHHSQTDHPDPSIFEMHAHEHFEIFYFIRGEGAYMVEGNEYPLEPGSLLIMRPVETHKLVISGDQVYERIAIHFTEELVSSVDESGQLLEAFNDRPIGKGNLYLPWEFPSDGVKGIMRKITETYDDKEKKLSLKCNLFPLLFSIRSSFLSKKEPLASSSQDNSDLTLVEYINTHLFESLSLDFLSKKMFLSKSQLERNFKKITGTSIGEYITIKRLMEARRLLRLNEPATKVAQMCGYSDYSSFYRAYKKRFGVSPSNDA